MEDSQGDHPLDLKELLNGLSGSGEKELTRDRFLAKFGEGIHEMILVVIDSLVERLLPARGIHRDTTSDFSSASRIILNKLTTLVLQFQSHLASHTSD